MERQATPGCSACSTPRSKASTATAVHSMPSPSTHQPTLKASQGVRPVVAVTQVATASAAGSAAPPMTARTRMATSLGRSKRASKPRRSITAWASNGGSTTTAAPISAAPQGMPVPSSATPVPTATPSSTPRPQRHCAASARPAGRAMALHGASARLKVPA